MTRFCLIGPTYPYRGGIAHYTTLLAQHLREAHEVLLISFARQYPGWLFPGRSDKDPSERPLRTEAEYLLDPLNPLTWWRTVRRIEEWQPDVVVIPWWHPFWTPAWAVVGRMVKRLRKPPRLLFICHNVLPHEQSLLDKAALRLALTPGDGFITHFQADADQLQQQLPNARIEVTSIPAYTLVGWEPAVTLPVTIPVDRPLLLFFGFVRPYKGLDILLEALPLVLTRWSLHLLVVGEFWKGEEEYQEQITRLQLQKSVTLINHYIPDEELVAYIRAATVVVLPYRHATQSAAVQLAFGLGCPVITTRVGGLAEAVEDGRTGLLVRPENPQALATAINRFFAEGLEPVFRRNLAQQNGHISWTRLITKLSQL